MVTGGLVSLTSAECRLVRSFPQINSVRWLSQFGQIRRAIEMIMRNDLRRDGNDPTAAQGPYMLTLKLSTGSINFSERRNAQCF